MIRETILKTVAANPGATLFDIHSLTGIDSRKLKRHLYEMLKEGQLSTDGVERVPQCTKRVYRYVVGSEGRKKLSQSASPPHSKLVASIGPYAKLGPWAVCTWNIMRGKHAWQQKTA